MKDFLKLAAFIFFPVFASAQNEYTYHADLVNVKKDQVAIELHTPPVKEKTIIYSFPKAIPGSYSQKDFGRFITEFTAYDNAGKKLKVKKLNPNQYEIASANELKKITYKVDDTWDEMHPNFVFQPGGTNIEAGKNFVLNNHAFFGYLEGYKMLPIKLVINKPEDMYGATNMKVDRTPTKDVLYAKDYVFLADNPIVYAKPDTTSFLAGTTKINISVYSATGKVKSEQIAGWLKPMASALAKFFNGLPVASYQFLYYFDDPATSMARKNNGGGYGALEHNYSSLYYLPEVPLESQLKSLVNEVSSHEFLHILTPLNLHSKEIHDFDYVNPKMSKHLWLYEGVTEYFAHLVQLQHGIISEEEFFKNMRSKIGQAKEHWDFSMTEMSKNVLTDQYKSKYESVYNKGALLGLALDLFIREKTDHKKDLKDVVLSLSKKFGPEKPFDDETFFDDFIAASHPAVRGFIADYIEGAKPLPINEYMDKMGYEFAQEKQVNGYFISTQLGLKYDDVNNKFLFTTGSGENALAIKNNDVFYKINGIEVTEKNLEEVWEKYFRSNSTIPTLTLTVIRNGVETELKGDLYKGYKNEQDYVGPVDNPTTEQKRMLEKIVGRS
ncbi:hypothetical protein [Aridibaculum aurantiacum]|uniref:M61 family metallopeptidase n=1 Tax=Aridibaculum aurantiacum TaxID=2810307 RepID=UPI001A97D105|nr:hypothetical protein [Aridibaculum aurantiacum]